MSISGIIVRTRPEHLPVVERALLDSGLCEIHFCDDAGRIVVTIEGTDVDGQVEKLRSIQQLPHVLAADMAYVYAGNEDEDADADPDADEPPCGSRPPGASSTP